MYHPPNSTTAIRRQGTPIQSNDAVTHESLASFAAATRAVNDARPAFSHTLRHTK